MKLTVSIIAFQMCLVGSAYGLADVGQHPSKLVTTQVLVDNAIHQPDQVKNVKIDSGDRLALTTVPDALQRGGTIQGPTLKSGADSQLAPVPPVLAASGDPLAKKHDCACDTCAQYRDDRRLIKENFEYHETFLTFGGVGMVILVMLQIQDWISRY